MQLAGPGRGSSLCASCVLTRTRPDYQDEVAREELARAEMAKRRLVFQLAELGLPLTPWDPETGTGVAFDLLSSSETKVMTGHQAGVITLDLAEADSEHRERLRLQLSEPYRTLLGHYRHEIGHYLWPQLVDRADRPRPVPRPLRRRASRLRRGAEAALRLIGGGRPGLAGPPHQPLRHHASGRGLGRDLCPLPAYPRHAADRREFRPGHRSGQGEPSSGAAHPEPTRPDGSATFAELMAHWLELTYALNQINRSMGQPDLYPFVVAPRVMDKLALVDRLVRDHAQIDVSPGERDRASDAHLSAAGSPAAAR